MEQTTQITTPKTETFSIETILSKAIEEKVPIETMEKLLAMRRELKAEWAKERFDEAMAKFQAECPVIQKKEAVDFTSKRTGSRTSYKYAPLDEIVKQTKEFIAKNGLSYTIETENTDTAIKSIVTVKHQAGHSEKTHFEVPIDKESYMNAQQQYGSASTFSKRYAFCNAFGILTGDDDNDAIDASEVKDKPQPARTYQVNNQGKRPPESEVKGIRPASGPQLQLIKKLILERIVNPKKIIAEYGEFQSLDVRSATEIINRLKELPFRQSQPSAPESKAKQLMKQGMGKQTTGFGAPADELPTIQVDDDSSVKVSRKDSGIFNPETGENYPLLEPDEEINVDDIPF